MAPLEMALRLVELASSTCPMVEMNVPDACRGYAEPDGEGQSVSTLAEDRPSDRTAMEGCES